jgi:hypothetical protein
MHPGGCYNQHMTYGDRHVLRSRRESQNTASIVVAWLNATDGQPANCRLTRVIDLMGDLHRLRDADLPRAKLHPSSKTRATKEQTRNLRKVVTIRKRLNALLINYRFSPNPQSRYGKWLLEWRHSHQRSRVDMTVAAGGVTFPVCEGDTLLMFCGLVEQGYFERIRRCRLCSRWLFASFKHQQYCSTKCQVGAYKSTEEWKALRRNYMRRYRRLKASGKVR